MIDYKDTRYSSSNRVNKFNEEHSDLENGVTFEEAQLKMAYLVFPIERAIEGPDEILGPKDNWTNYFDIGLKYRWYEFNQAYYNDSSEDIPVHLCGKNFTEEGFDEPDPLYKEAILASFNFNLNAMCIDDNDKYKLFGERQADKMGSIQLEVAACDPSARADPSSCETDEVKLREFVDRTIIRVVLVTSFKDYDTHSY